MFAKVREVLIFTHSNFIDKSVRRCLYNVNYESGRGAAASRAAGAEQRYLIQHLAGSGKSFTIAWLSHQLATLHDASDRRVFDSTVVVAD